MKPSLAALALLCTAFVPDLEARATTIVPGSANPNLAGRSNDYTCCNGDSVPDQVAKLVSEVPILECDTVRFAVSGRVSFTETLPPGNNPDGDDTYSMINYGDGISAPSGVRANALVGVFLKDDLASAGPTPSSLDFSTGLDFSILFPEIGQIFFIGDGLTSDSKVGGAGGDLQDFVVPQDATSLFLGTVDGEGWFNNTGSFSVEIVEIASRCGDPSIPQGITAGDALTTLRAAVGITDCPDCMCDVDRSGSVVASDALTVLRRAVGQNVTLRCECCMLF